MTSPVFSPPTRAAVNRFIPLLATFLIFGCSTTQKLAAPARGRLEMDSTLMGAHVGICVFDPEKNSFLYNYQGSKFFVPASNTKLFSLYAGMKYLGDSLVGIRYVDLDTAILLFPAGDPTLLHADYPDQPVLSLLKGFKKRLYMTDENWQEQPWGSGWSWDDYNDDYMAERSALPVYGNVIRWVQEMQKKGSQTSGFEASPSVYSLPEVNWKVKFTTDTAKKNFHVQRALCENIYQVTEGTETRKTQDVPFVTNGISSAEELLKDSIEKDIITQQRLPALLKSVPRQVQTLHSRPVDSMYRPMMYRSDNFFAEQTLLMVSNERLGIMSDEKIIDTLLRSDLKGLPQRPNWADGSGLSRFNLFTPEDFVWLLNQLKNEFGLERMKRILPTGGSGTLGSRYRQYSGRIYAKTGSLSDVIALSGYLITQKNRLLIFSILVNNSTANGAAVRNAIERFVTGMISQN
jgi:D-alanyl-D-alanine carboxypeptidase/D-alanyl-D-alanine-endopeptidase (penicillin-binding protein 4)